MINLCQTSKANNVSLLNTVNVKVFPNEQVNSIFYARKKKKEKERKKDRNISQCFNIKAEYSRFCTIFLSINPSTKLIIVMGKQAM